jgi:hypothetical protein
VGFTRLEGCESGFDLLEQVFDEYAASIREERVLGAGDAVDLALEERIRAGNVTDDDGSDDTQRRGAKHAGASATSLHERRNPAAERGHEQQRSGHGQREPVVVDAAVERNLADQRERKDRGAERHDQAGPLVSVTAAPREQDRRRGPDRERE